MKIKEITEFSEEILNGVKAISNISEEEFEYREGDTFLLAMERGLILGYSHARPSISHILSLYVLKGYRKGIKKVGSSLLLKTIEKLSEKGIKDIQAGIEPTNKEVIPFYEKYGFNILGVSKNGFTTITYNVSSRNT